MGIVNTLKWLWDPRTEEQKRYEADPLRRYTQQFNIYIKDIETAFEKNIAFEDREFDSDWIYRVHIKSDVQKWLDNRAEKGIKLDNFWYPPAMIDRIEIGKLTVEEI